MKQCVYCLGIILFLVAFVAGQKLVTPISIKKLPRVTNKGIWIDLDNQYLEAWRKRGRKWKRVRQFPIEIGDEQNPTPKGIFYIYNKQNHVVNKNKTELGEVLDFVKRKDGNVWTILAIHGWLFYPDGSPGWGPTQGCIQLLRDDMHWVYRWTGLGTPVIIE